MVEATPPTLAARNAFAVLLVVLMVLFTYQQVDTVPGGPAIEGLFYLAASAYLVSWYYYRRGADAAGPEESAKREE